MLLLFMSSSIFFTRERLSDSFASCVFRDERGRDVVDDGSVERKTEPEPRLVYTIARASIVAIQCLVWN